MPFVNDPESIQSLITEGLRAFLENTHRRPWQVVVWLEHEHEQCGLHISTADGNRDIVPADFDYPNFALEEVGINRRLHETICERDVDDDCMEELYAEFEKIVKAEAGITSSTEAPSVWGVQVGLGFYKTWDS